MALGQIFGEDSVTLFVLEFVRWILYYPQMEKVAVICSKCTEYYTLRCLRAVSDNSYDPPYRGCGGFLVQVWWILILNFSHLK